MPVMLSPGLLPAQNRDDSRDMPATGNAQDRPGVSESLSEGQKAAVKSILSKYHAATLTADDAKAIHRAFRDAGVKSGPGLNEAVTSAGFDSDRLRDLDPPPSRHEDSGEKKP